MYSIDTTQRFAIHLQSHRYLCVAVYFKQVFTLSINRILSNAESKWDYTDYS